MSRCYALAKSEALQGRNHLDTVTIFGQGSKHGFGHVCKIVRGRRVSPRLT